MLAKCDLTSAFNQLGASPGDWHKLGFVWDDLFYICLCLPFGLSSAPKSFDLFAQALHYIAIKYGTSPWSSHYLDDTITLKLRFLRTKDRIKIFKKTASDAG